MLIPIILLLTIPFTVSLDCYPPPRGTKIPILDHCQELVHALHYASRLPPNEHAKEWGRGLPSTDFTEYLPKVYWLPGRGPQSCALSIDVDPLYPDAKEVFKLGDIAVAGTRIVNLCLIGRREIGRDFLGRTGKVTAKLVRTDTPKMIQAARGERYGQSVRVPGVGRLMWMDRPENGSLAADLR
ncbi:MAG: hypothetical protein L6R40_006318 [Gallowayella cf. fulva]|nr:MAG: hypothetical protein L6R40_006318 [Xanthomendoza cf. fulva]